MAYTEEVPPELNEDILLIDDRVGSITVFNTDGRLKQEKVTIDSVHIEQMVRKFDLLLRYSYKYEE